jgi:hypothetical protein
MNARSYDAEVELQSALDKHSIKLETLVAETAIWANPEVHKRRADAGNPAWFPNIRRAKIGSGEKRRQTINGITFDDNTAANNAIKQSIGLPRSLIKGYAVCHIWPSSCYDENCHTVIANLVLLPRALAGLSDHYRPIEKLLQYRSYELYGWLPPNTDIPVKPDNYVTCWKEPEPDPTHLRRERSKGSSPSLIKKASIEERIFRWSNSPNSNVYKIISLAIKHEGMSRQEFIRLLQDHRISQNPNGAVASLMTDAGNSYGFVLEQGAEIAIRPEVKPILERLSWK